MISVRVGGVNTTIVAVNALQVTERDAARACVAAGGAAVLTAARTNMMSRDHSLRDLAKLDHPYARRHGSIQAGKLGHSASPYLDDQANQVHAQSGAMLAGLKVGVPTVGSGPVNVGVGWPSPPKHVPFVVLGTRVMLPRDVLTDTLNSQGTRKLVMQTMVRTLGAELRAKSAIRFTNGPVGQGAIAS